MRQQLAGLLHLVERMQARAATGDWDEVAVLRDRFQQGAESLFAGNTGAAELPELRDLIGRLGAINSEVIGLCRTARDERGRELEKLQQGRRAVSRYAANTR